MTENGSPPVEEWEHPLCLLANPMDYIRWVLSAPAAETDAIQSDVIRRHMVAYGARSVLDVGEKIEDATEVCEEFLPA